jgi:hypothetical protein
MVYDSEFREYKGLDIFLFAGYLGIPGVTYSITDNPPKPRRYCWIYEIKAPGHTICDVGFPDKETAFANAKLVIDSNPVAV